MSKDASGSQDLSTRAHPLPGPALLSAGRDPPVSQLPSLGAFLGFDESQGCSTRQPPQAAAELSAPPPSESLLQALQLFLETSVQGNFLLLSRSWAQCPFGSIQRDLTSAASLMHFPPVWSLDLPLQPEKDKVGNDVIPRWSQRPSPQTPWQSLQVAIDLTVPQS